MLNIGLRYCTCN